MADIKILCIGNSYSVGATRYLHQIAESYGDNIDVLNYYIGGCSLQRHADNIKFGYSDYRMFRNGCWTSLPNVKITDYINACDWDFVTLQQASYLSFRWESYMPHLVTVADFVRENCPNSKLLIHQTQVCSDTRCKREFKISGCDEMYTKLIDCYNKASCEIGAVGILPTGEASMLAHKKYGVIDNILYSDPGSHLSNRYGEYMAALTWYSVLTGKDVSEDNFSIEGADERFTEIMRLCANEAAKDYRL